MQQSTICTDEWDQQNQIISIIILFIQRVSMTTYISFTELTYQVIQV